jgi:hypothetical protein
METSLRPSQRQGISKSSPKTKRNLDNSSLKKHFGKGDLHIWDKDIYTGEGNE